MSRAKPLTYSEWADLRTRFPAVSIEPEKQCKTLLGADIPDRLEATIEAGGFAPDPPTPYELDKWAARKVMGWRKTGDTWVRKDDTIAGFENVILVRDWQPSQDLGQALECVERTNRRCQIVVDEQGATVSDQERYPGLGYWRVYHGPYDEAAMAEAILRRLYREIAS